MTQSLFLHDHGRSDWVRLSTLILLRWCAIAGQVLAVGVTVLVLDIELATWPVITMIGLLIIANLRTTLSNPRSKLLNEGQATVFLLIDVVQLSTLVALTGGLSNPFVMLLLAPVTMAATVLQMRGYVAAAALAIGAGALMEIWHLPMRLPDGSLLEMPPLFRTGTFIALVIGVVFLGLYARRVTTEMHAMGAALVATQSALEREQKLTDLAGVVAATAHELGTPLATIKLVSGELADELKDQPDLAEDVALIRTQADRCRDILRSMGRAGKDDELVKTAPLQSVVEEASAPHLDRVSRFEILYDTPGEQPMIQRRAEIVHGLRNLLQNAVDFASEAVLVRLSWDNNVVTIRIIDDGPGFPANQIDHLGHPIISRRPGGRRAGYEGMGLGLFIAKTLLERTGASLRFANRQSPRGAIVVIQWPADALTPGEQGALGQNQHFA